jgi:hypothetical protein
LAMIISPKKWLDSRRTPTRRSSEISRPCSARNETARLEPDLLKLTLSSSTFYCLFFAYGYAWIRRTKREEAIKLFYTCIAAASSVPILSSSKRNKSHIVGSLFLAPLDYSRRMQGVEKDLVKWLAMLAKREILESYEPTRTSIDIVVCATGTGRTVVGCRSEEQQLAVRRLSG